MKKIYYIIGAQAILCLILGIFIFIQKMEIDELKTSIQQTLSEVETQKIIAEKERAYAHEQRKKAIEKDEEIKMLKLKYEELVEKQKTATQKLLKDNLNW